MLCEKCKKNQANTYYKTTVNGKTAEMCLCGECAEKLGIGSVWADNSFFDEPFFGSLFDDSFFGKALGLASPRSVKRCPDCGATLDYISQSGKVGCATCYDTFEKELQAAIMRAQGSVKHLGSEKPENEKEKKAEVLREEMKKAIEAEDFEKAAKLRDEIKGLEA